ncbi:endonuclease domain-containing protein [Leptolyngbya sp. 7M]|uniref:endonuclease domain-containing protein n=1 Tax=Leptolyngbya sp. 7M TaxID=2812896 RepID=UPI001B8D991E|nr:endonuclease domain-containing protein [Leptolyngbya sp. 7M]QYO64665.1 endonuclease domain-containing protein [Leptolyngbya sp. 7M]
MTRLYNKTTQLEKRRLLRQRSTPAETTLWAKLRGGKLENCKFRRQYSIDVFVVDFYAPDLKLAIEVDGGYHTQPETIPYDQERQQFLEAHGICIVRFSNEQIEQQLDEVLAAIAQTVRQLRQSPPL